MSTFHFRDGRQFRLVTKINWNGTWQMASIQQEKEQNVTPK